jgi:hypothetical protein
MKWTDRRHINDPSSEQLNPGIGPKNITFRHAMVIFYAKPMFCLDRHENRLAKQPCVCKFAGSFFSEGRTVQIETLGHEPYGGAGYFKQVKTVLTPSILQAKRTSDIMRPFWDELPEA